MANANLKAESKTTTKAETKAESKKMEREAAAAPVSSTKIELTPEAKIVADNFRANRGRLPFPVERGLFL